jgi:hypothetical protein
LSKSNVFNAIEKNLIDIFKWSCILDLKLLVKSYNGKKNESLKNKTKLIFPLLKRLICTKEQFSKSFTKNLKRQTLFKSNILCTIAKLLKHRYLKWFSFCNFRLWPKETNQRSIFLIESSFLFFRRERHLEIWQTTFLSIINFSS